MQDCWLVDLENEFQIIVDLLEAVREFFVD